MTIFTITTEKHRDGGASATFSASSDFGSPNKSELETLKIYLTPKAMKILKDGLEGDFGQSSQPPSKS
jgi:hypothetical protein